VKSCEELKETPDTTSYSESLWPVVSDDCSTDYGPLSETSPEPDEDVFTFDLESIKGHAMEKVAETEESEVDANFDETVIVTEIVIPRENPAEEEIAVTQSADLELPPIVNKNHHNPVATEKPAETQHVTCLQQQFASDEDSKMCIPNDSEGTEVSISRPSEEEMETLEQAVLTVHEEDTHIKRVKTPDTDNTAVTSPDDQGIAAAVREKKTLPSNSKGTGHQLQKSKADKRRKQAQRSTRANTDEIIVQKDDGEEILPEKSQGELEQEVDQEQSVIATEMKQDEKGEVAEGNETKPTSGEEGKEPQENHIANTVSNERKRDRERRRVAKRERREYRKRVEEENKQQQLEVSNDVKDIEREDQEKVITEKHHCQHENEVVGTVEEANETDSEEERHMCGSEEEDRKRMEEMQRLMEEQERLKREEELRQQQELRRRHLEEQRRREEQQKKEEEEMRERIRRQIEASRALALEYQIHASHLKTEMDNVNQGLQITPPFVWSYFYPSTAKLQDGHQEMQ
jgi:hypothetical protein